MSGYVLSVHKMVWFSVKYFQQSHFVHVCNVPPFKHIQEPNQMKIDKRMEETNEAN